MYNLEVNKITSKLKLFKFTDLPEKPCNHLKSATTPMIPTLRRTFLLQHIHTTSYKREVYDTDSAQFSLV